LAFNSSLLKGEVRASKQQQGPTSWASPVGRCPTSWIFAPYIVPTEQHRIQKMRDGLR
jgi:hypothetical protein